MPRYGVPGSAPPRALTRRAIAAGLLVGTLTVPLSQPAAAAEDVAARWYDVTAETVAAGGTPATPIIDSRVWAISWLAAARALRSGPGLSPQAAVATAVHDSLKALVPSRTAQLDEALTMSLDQIPQAGAKREGIAAGQKAAADTVAERQGDGLDLTSVNLPWMPPHAVPGVWQPTPPAYGPAIQAGQGNAKPFLLGTASRFRPVRPPAVGSRIAVRDLAEVHDVGAVDSTVRTDAQTTTAKIWAQGSLSGYTQALRAISHDGGLTLVRRTSLLAAFHVISVDAQIACQEAKYTYTYWRPVTAVRAGGETGWTPLIPTPPHPEYPSGHTTYAGFAQTVLSAFLGPDAPTPFTVTNSYFPGLTSRTYTRWDQLTRDNVDARVWSGIHYRNTDEVGVNLGQNIARFDLARLPLLFG